MLKCGCHCHINGKPQIDYGYTCLYTLMDVQILLCYNCQVALKVDYLGSPYTQLRTSEENGKLILERLIATLTSLQDQLDVERYLAKVAYDV